MNLFALALTKYESYELRFRFTNVSKTHEVNKISNDIVVLPSSLDEWTTTNHVIPLNQSTISYVVQYRPTLHVFLNYLFLN